MTEHTPGPWTVGPMHETVRPDGFERIGISNNGCIICDVYGRDEKPANARLIALAPDLLEELQEAASQAYCGCDHPACKQCVRDRRWQKIINKATGA